MIEKVLILIGCFSFSSSTLDISNAKLKLTWAPSHSKCENRYPRFHLTNVSSNKLPKRYLICVHPKRAQCFETFDIIQSIKDGKITSEQQHDSIIEEEENALKISGGIDFRDATLKETVPMVPNPNPRKKVWILKINNQILHCYRRRRSNYLEKLGVKYKC